MTSLLDNHLREEFLCSLSQTSSDPRLVKAIEELNTAFNHFPLHPSFASFVFPPLWSLLEEEVTQQRLFLLKCAYYLLSNDIEQLTKLSQYFTELLKSRWFFDTFGPRYNPDIQETCLQVVSSVISYFPEGNLARELAQESYRQWICSEVSKIILKSKYWPNRSLWPIIGTKLLVRSQAFVDVPDFLFRIEPLSWDDNWHVRESYVKTLSLLLSNLEDSVKPDNRCLLLSYCALLAKIEDDIEEISTLSARTFELIVVQQLNPDLVMLSKFLISLLLVPADRAGEVRNREVILAISSLVKYLYSRDFFENVRNKILELSLPLEDKLIISLMRKFGRISPKMVLEFFIELIDKFSKISIGTLCPTKVYQLASYSMEGIAEGFDFQNPVDDGNREGKGKSDVDEKSDKRDDGKDDDDVDEHVSEFMNLLELRMIVVEKCLKFLSKHFSEMTEKGDPEKNQFQVVFINSSEILWHIILSILKTFSAKDIVYFSVPISSEFSFSPTPVSSISTFPFTFPSHPPTYNSQMASQWCFDPEHLLLYSTKSHPFVDTSLDRFFSSSFKAFYNLVPLCFAFSPIVKWSSEKIRISVQEIIGLIRLMVCPHDSCTKFLTRFIGRIVQGCNIHDVEVTSMQMENESRRINITKHIFSWAVLNSDLDSSTSPVLVNGILKSTFSLMNSASTENKIISTEVIQFLLNNHVGIDSKTKTKLMDSMFISLSFRESPLLQILLPTIIHLAACQPGDKTIHVKGKNNKDDGNQKECEVELLSPNALEKDMMTTDLRACHRLFQQFLYEFQYVENIDHLILYMENTPTLLHHLRIYITYHLKVMSQNVFHPSLPPSCLHPIAKPKHHHHG
eukprot:TRINITY_DN7989_c0_g2_i9.p1 TRINITY_DN7989_c0_g2~~TRINITY_DN7989_c0_g2_i9.p1  ORF type:complete len:852 (-),score=173.15 TRINITY_DN7989_c0_g2_i9:141-2696(-)